MELNQEQMSVLLTVLQYLAENGDYDIFDDREAEVIDEITTLLLMKGVQPLEV